MRHSLQRMGLGLGLAVLLASGLEGTSEAQQPPEPERVSVLIGFVELPDAADEALVRGAGGEVRFVYHLVPAIAATVPVPALQGLSRNPRVTVIEPDGLVRAIDAELDASRGVVQIGGGIAHDMGNTGLGVRVGILDTGIDYNHPDLAANYVEGRDFINGDDDPMDDHGHGTHVAGTVAAADNGFGVVGVAPEAMLYGVKVLSGSGGGSWSAIIAGLQYAVDMDLDVTNNSYGASGNPGSIVERAYDNALAAGVLNIAANGNSGSCAGTGDSVNYPAKFDSVVGVAAISSSDTRACFSSTGPTTELAAPGVSVYSTKRGGGYTTMSGTSMASPHAAGVAALVFGAGMTDPAAVRQRLIDTADDLGDAGHDAWYGHGRVDAAEAADLGTPVNQPPSVTVMSPADGTHLDSGASVDLMASASDPEDGPIADVAWSSNIDGPLGTGTSLSVQLSDGVHTVSASVADSGGRTASDSVQVTLSAPGPVPDTAAVTSIGYAGRGGRSSDKHLDVILSLTDGFGPLAGATVAVRITETGSGATYQGSAVSDASGLAVVGLKNVGPGCYVTAVVGVQASGLTWDGTTPTNGSCP